MKFLLLILALFLSKPPQTFAADTTTTIIKIGLIDTGLCSIDKPWQGVSFELNALYRPFADTSSPPPIPCSQVLKSSTFNRQYHAFYVLDTLMRTLAKKPLKNSVALYPVQIYDSKGESSPNYWEKAIDHLKSKKIDILILTSSLIHQNEERIKTLQLPALTFAAAATGGPYVKKDTPLWPVSHLKRDPQLVVVGQFAPANSDNLALNLHRQGQVDPEILWPETLDFLEIWAPKDSPLTGSSYSTPLLVAKFIHSCSPNNLNKTCLESKSSLLKATYTVLGAVRKQKNYRVLK